ncbi:MAG: shikimate kinase [Anaerolineales bacterium]
MMRRHLILTGFMGSGKTTVGRLLALRLGWEFIDTDEEIVRRMQMSISEIFAHHGEPAFRQVEAQVCAEVSARAAPTVIALGGGALLHGETRRLLEERGYIFSLTCQIEEILRRLGEGEGRPLFRPQRESLESLLKARAPIYERYPQIDTTARTPEEVAGEILRLWNTLH